MLCENQSKYRVRLKPTQWRHSSITDFVSWWGTKSMDNDYYSPLYLKYCLIHTLLILIMRSIAI